MDTIHRCSRRLRYLLVAAAALPALARAQDGRTPAVAPLRSGTLSFTAHATTGAFVGTTTAVTGRVEGTLNDARGWVEAPIATLTTHNDLRDRDMRAALEAGKYPTMRFDLASLTLGPPADGSGDSVSVLLHGTLTIHGVTRAVELPAIVSLGGDSARVVAAFPLDVTQYRVGGLTKAFGLLRMQRQIEVRLDLMFVSPGARTARANER
jgi:polyisoprenoid-binding protein YceI